MTTIVERPAHRHGQRSADTPTVPFRVRDTRIPLPAWLHDDTGLRLALAVNGGLLVVALLLAPIAAVLV